MNERAEAVSDEELSGHLTTHVKAVPWTEDGAVRLHAEAAEAFQALRNAAAESGIALRIASAFRSFDYQQKIWNQKLSGERAILDAQENRVSLQELTAREQLFALLHWSALPGASRHHWGSDLDVYDGSALPADYHVRLTRRESFSLFADLHRWLDERIAADRSFGFYRPYQGQGGVAQEPWHISYAPLASHFALRITPAFLLRAIIGRKLLQEQLVLQNLPQIYRKFVLPYQNRVL